MQVKIRWILLVLVISVNGLPFEEPDYWMRYGTKRLKDTLYRKNMIGHAKNVIVFIGDGMGMATVTAARIYKGQQNGHNGEEYVLAYEKFPNVGLSKTYNVDKQVPDSAGTATAIFTGVKSKWYMLGLRSTAKYGDCDKKLNEISKLDSVMTWAQEAGKDTGVVTTTRITHATPASLYSHINHRDWECDSKIPPEQRSCVKDIARQLVEDEPGKNFKVILGGGLRQFGITKPDIDDDSCNRTDNRNLVDTWKKEKENYRHSFVSNTGDLMNADVKSLDYLFGLFSSGHMPYALERDHSPEGTPSIKNMTQKAIEMLSKNPAGFVLVVEGGRIDLAHHANYARMALDEAAELDDAVAYAVANTDPKETLIIVTADHSHSFTINGYPNRGNDILGFANKTAEEGLYETLTYANGPGFDTHRSLEKDCTSTLWKVAPESERQKTRYRHFSPYNLADDTHGGEDVPVYSLGPSAHLLSGTFEENYIGHVISYSACIGPHSKMCDSKATLMGVTSGSASTPVLPSHALLLVALCSFLKSR